MNTGIIWDIDGTICNSHHLCLASTNAVLQKHGRLPITEDDYHHGVQFTTPRRMAWHYCGDPDHSIGTMLGKDFDEMYVQLVSPATAPLYPGIKEIFHDIRNDYSPNLAFGALSNACTAYVKKVLQTHILSDLVSIQLGADEVSAAKPAPDGLLYCCHQLQLPPSQCVYIGDSPSDGQAARNAQLYSIGVTWGSHSKEKLTPHFHKIVSTSDELRNEIISFITNRY